MKQTELAGLCLLLTVNLLTRQPNAASLEMLVENHRNALSALKTIGQALSREVEGWKTNVVALQKMRSDEEKAFKKVKEKEAKAAERKLAQEKKKKAKLAKQKAEREAREAAEKGKEEGDHDEGKKRKRRTGGLTELTDEDPPVLRDMPKFTEANISMVETVKDFVSQIGASPLIACVARVKKGMFKKVLTESFLHHSQTCLDFTSRCICLHLHWH